MSHWNVVTERPLGIGWFGVNPGSEEEAKCWDLVISRVDHIHARIGTDQHAQVSDPSPENRKFYEGTPLPLPTPFSSLPQPHSHFFDQITLSHLLLARCSLGMLVIPENFLSFVVLPGLNY
jgi:hypothetical protein